MSATRHAVTRLPPLALLFLALSGALPAHAAGDDAGCGAAELAVLGRELRIDHFVPGPADFGQDADGVVVASSCRRSPDDPRLTLAAVAWDAQAEDGKSLVVAVIDSSTALALLKDEIGEDAATRVTGGSLRLDTAPYRLAAGVRAFGVDVLPADGSCGEGGVGPSRTLYVREGRTLRPVLQGLTMSEYRYVRGNKPGCVSDQREAETAIVEDFKVAIGLGIPGKGGWRDLVLTATSKRSDHKPGRRPLHVHVRYDGSAYPLDAFQDAWTAWRK
jgi:hypothetical protein